MRKNLYKGQAALEYMLLLAVVAAVVIVALRTMLPRSQGVTEGYFNSVTNVIMGANPNPIDGQWCGWQPECSNDGTCGPKVQRRVCECPEPAFGGRPCRGSDPTVRRCPVQQGCPPCIKARDSDGNVICQGDWRCGISNLRGFDSCGEECNLPYEPCNPFCGDNYCTSSVGEVCYQVQNAFHTPGECQQDCGNCPFCGDTRCNGDEVCVYPDGTSDAGGTPCLQDCGICCGDRSCEAGENHTNCPLDCPFQCTGVIPPNAVECPVARPSGPRDEPWRLVNMCPDYLDLVRDGGCYLECDTVNNFEMSVFGNSCTQRCGNGICNSSESCTNCLDCGPPPPTQITISAIPSLIIQYCSGGNPLNYWASDTPPSTQTASHVCDINGYPGGAISYTTINAFCNPPGIRIAQWNGIQAICTFHACGVPINTIYQILNTVTCSLPPAPCPAATCGNGICNEGETCACADCSAFCDHNDGRCARGFEDCTNARTDCAPCP